MPNSIEQLSRRAGTGRECEEAIYKKYARLRNSSSMTRSSNMPLPNLRNPAVRQFGWNTRTTRPIRPEPILGTSRQLATQRQILLCASPCVMHASGLVKLRATSYARSQGRSSQNAFPMISRCNTTTFPVKPSYGRTFFSFLWRIRIGADCPSVSGPFVPVSSMAWSVR